MDHSISQLIFSMNGNNLNKMIKVLCIMDNGKMIKNVEEVNKYGEMAQFMKGHFKMIWQMVVEDLFILVVTFMKEIGLMIKHKEKESTCILMDQCTLVNGLTINNMVMGSKNGSMGHNMKEILKMDLSKVMEFFFGLMGQIIRVNFISIKLKVTENMYGLIKDNIKDFGKIIRCMERVSLLGQMVEDIKASTLLIKSKERVFLYGQMEDHMTVSGKMESKTVKEFSDLKMVHYVKEYGKMVKNLNGLET